MDKEDPTVSGYKKIRKAQCARVCSRRGQSSAPNPLQHSACRDPTPGRPPSRPAERPVKSPGARRAGMVAVRKFRPDLGAASPRGPFPPTRIPATHHATRAPPHYLRLVVISRVRHGYGAPKPRGKERKTYSAPARPDRKSRPTQA